VSTEGDLDRLYQLPLRDFISERNALAKRSGGEGMRIKALEKPATPAWAVNQLYWRERRVYDRLVRAAGRSRAAHARALAGRNVDTRMAALEHDAAVRDAVEQAKAILKQAGDPATDATMKAVAETVRALPAAGEPGRLTHPIALVGFAAFGDMLRGAVSVPTRSADVISFVPAKAKKTAPDRQAAEQAKREREAAAARLKRIQAGKRAADVSLSRARRELARVEQTRQDLHRQLQDADSAIVRLRAEATRLEREIEAAAKAEGLESV
jgi:uncharacterized protein (DUF3084 family)